MSASLMNSASGPVEAVIITGPRKGEIVNLTGDDIVLSPEEEKAFDEFQAQLERTLKTAQEAVAVARQSREQYRASRAESCHGPD